MRVPPIAPGFFYLAGGRARHCAIDGTFNHGGGNELRRCYCIAAASAGGDDDLVHFLVTNTNGKGLPSFRLTIPKKHLESLPSSYLSAMSSERWVGNSTDRGTAVSPFAVSVDDCPPNIRAIWDKYCHRAPDLVPFVKKAYARAVATTSTSEEKQMVLPHEMDLQDAVHFLVYYGLVPQGQDIWSVLVVPEDAPAAVMLRSILYPKEANLVKVVRDALVAYLRKNPERTTYFVFAKWTDNLNYIKTFTSTQEEDVVVPFHFSSKSAEDFGLGEDGQECIDEVARKSSLRTKLISHLTEVDKLKAEFVTEETHLVELKELEPPDGKREEQTLVVCDMRQFRPQAEEGDIYDYEDEMEWFHEQDNRLIRWRYVLKVQIPDV